MKLLLNHKYISQSSFTNTYVHIIELPITIVIIKQHLKGTSFVSRELNIVSLYYSNSKYRWEIKTINYVTLYNLPTQIQSTINSYQISSEIFDSMKLCSHFRLKIDQFMINLTVSVRILLVQMSDWHLFGNNAI